MVGREQAKTDLYNKKNIPYNSCFENALELNSNDKVRLILLTAAEHRGQIWLLWTKSKSAKI